MERLTSRNALERWTSASETPELKEFVMVRGKALGRAYFESDEDYKDYRDALDRLAAYEDTGLEPEEIEARQDVCLWIPEERFSEIIKAEAEGRLIVLPCKVGDTVYHRDCYGKIYEATVQSIVIDKSRTIFITSGIGFDETAVGKTVFLTRAEAEKAMVSG